MYRRHHHHYHYCHLFTDFMLNDLYRMHTAVGKIWDLLSQLLDVSLMSLFFEFGQAGFVRSFYRSSLWSKSVILWLKALCYVLFFFLKLKCTGEEKRLERCAHNGWGNHSCSHDEDAGVRCTGPDTTRECVTECGDGYYLKNGKRQCAACSSSCLTCKDSPDSCTSCDSSKFLRKTGMLKKWRHFSHAKCYYRTLVSVDVIGHFRDDDIWVQLPQFISSPLSYLN